MTGSSILRRGEPHKHHTVSPCSWIPNFMQLSAGTRWSVQQCATGRGRRSLLHDASGFPASHSRLTAVAGAARFVSKLLFLATMLFLLQGRRHHHPPDVMTLARLSHVFVCWLAASTGIDKRGRTRLASALPIALVHHCHGPPPQAASCLLSSMQAIPFGSGGAWSPFQSWFSSWRWASMTSQVGCQPLLQINRKRVVQHRKLRNRLVVHRL
ncbi:hypothetical protein BKA80DRAFT_58576 [Phyllosticta citrichinensis]